MIILVMKDHPNCEGSFMVMKDHPGYEGSSWLCIQLKQLQKRSIKNFQASREVEPVIS